MALSGNKYDGIDLEITWDGDDIEAELIRSASFSFARDTHDKTGAGQTAREKHPGRYDFTANFEFLQTDEDADLSTIILPETKETDSVTFTIYPNGNTAGEPTRTGSGIITDIQETNPAGDDMVVVSVTVDVDGELTKGTVSS